jgi:hypothetical protein
MKKTVFALLTVLGATALQARHCDTNADCREWARENCPAGFWAENATCYRAGTADATCICGGMVGATEPISQ